LKDDGDNVIWSTDMYMEPEKLKPEGLRLMLSNMGNLGMYYFG